MKREKRIDLHDREVVSEQDECGDMDDVLRPTPKVGKQFRCRRGEEPDKVANDNVPGQRSVSR